MLKDYETKDLNAVFMHILNIFVNLIHDLLFLSISTIESGVS